VMAAMAFLLGSRIESLAVPWSPRKSERLRWGLRQGRDRAGGLGSRGDV